MSRPRRTRAEQQAETRARLLDAAASEFAAHGFAGASIDAITQRAGYTRGAFYSNFEDKASLLLELSAAQMARFSEQALPGILAATEPERIPEAARYLVEEAPATELLLLVELARLRDSSPEVGEVLDELTSRSLAFVDGVLAAAEATSAAAAGGEPTAAAGGEPTAAATATPSAAGTSSDAATRAVRTRGLLAAVLGVLVLRHLGVEVDRAVAELLFSGVLGDPAMPGEPATRDDAAAPGDPATRDDAAATPGPETTR